MSLQVWQCQDRPSIPGPSPREETAGIQEGLCFHPPLLEEGPTPTPLQAVWAAAGGLLGETVLGCPIGSTAACESTRIPLPLPLPLKPASPKASQGTRRVNRGICQLCLAAQASSAPTPYEPSWKAASLPVGGAGGWAWEAPKVSTIVSLPQHFQGLDSFGSCRPVGHRLSSHTCYGVVHQKTRTVSLLLEHPQPCTPIFKHTLTVPKKANTHKPPPSKPRGSDTPILSLRAVH